MTILEALQSTGEGHTSKALRLLAEYLPVESRLVVTRAMIGAALRADRGDLQTLCAAQLAEDSASSAELMLDYIEDDGTRISIDDDQGSRLYHKKFHVQVEFTKKRVRSLRDLPDDDELRVRTAILAFAAGNLPDADVKKLKVSRDLSP